MPGWKYETGVIFDHVEFNTKIVMAISTGLVSLLLSRKSNFFEISSCTEYVLFYPYLLNPIPTGLGHVTLIYGLIPPMAGRNRVKL